MFLLFWLWLRARLRTPAEIERRRRRGHPWLFITAAGAGVTAMVAGDVGQGAVLFLLAGFLLWW